MNKSSEIKQTSLYHFMSRAFTSLQERPHIFNKFQKAEECFRNIVEKPLKLAVMGEFSTGKSSFLNRLLGINILPTGAMPVTSIITSLKYSEEDKLEISIKEASGNSTTKGYEGHANLKKWQTAFKEQDDLIQIQEIIVYLNNNYLKYFTVIDTPGLNDPKNYGQLTKNIFDKVNLVIWIFKANQAGTQTEKEFLEEFINLNPYKNNIYAVINYGDIVATNEKEYIDASNEINNLLKNSIGEYLINDHIYLISATSRDELWENAFSEFSKDLKEKVLEKDIQITRGQLHQQHIALKEAISTSLIDISDFKSKIKDKIQGYIIHERDTEVPHRKTAATKRIQSEIVNSVKQIETRLKNTSIWSKIQFEPLTKFAALYFTGIELNRLENIIKESFEIYINNFIDSLKKLSTDMYNFIEECPFPNEKLNCQIESKFENLLATLKFLSNSQQFLTTGYIIGLLSDDFIYKNRTNSPYKLLNHETIKTLVTLDTNIDYFFEEIKNMLSNIEGELEKDIKVISSTKQFIEELGG